MRAAVPRLGPDEQRLLLACARIAPAEELPAVLGRPLDWSAVLFFARLHSVTPLLHRHLRDRDDVPREVRRELLKHYQRVGYQNRLFAREHARLVDAFEAADVRFLVPKGISVVELFYGELASRPLLDLVYVVHPSDLSRAAELLESQGYVLRPGRPIQALYRWSAPQFFYRRKAKDLSVLVVLQPTLVTWPRLHRFDSDRVWSDARLRHVGDREVPILSAADQLIYLCLQVDNQGFFNRAATGTVDPIDLLFATWSNNRLIRFVDIRESIRVDQPEIDWSEVIHRARESLLGDTVHASLQLTNQLLGPSAPPDVIESLRPTAQPRMRSWLLEGLARDRLANPAQRFVGSAWVAAGRRQQDLARIVGLAEMAAPAPTTLAAADDLERNGSLLLRYAQHTGQVLFRSGSELLRASVDFARARRAKLRKR